MLRRMVLLHSSTRMSSWVRCVWSWRRTTHSGKCASGISEWTGGTDERASGISEWTEGTDERASGMSERALSATSFAFWGRTRAGWSAPSDAEVRLPDVLFVIRAVSVAPFAVCSTPRDGESVNPDVSMTPKGECCLLRPIRFVQRTSSRTKRSAASKEREDHFREWSVS
jgi:hypothetical protein